MNNFGKAVIVLAIVGVVGLAATSFADWGRGGGGNCWRSDDQRGGGPYGYQGNLSDEDLDRLSKERQAFFEDTSELRQQIYQKDLELRSEMAKKDPDANKAGAIQKEISDLKGQLDQKRINHRIKMQKENPDFFAGRGYGRGYGQGFRGRGMGRGFSGRGGGCWY